MSNFYLVWKWNHFIGDELQINIEFFYKINFYLVKKMLENSRRINS